MRDRRLLELAEANLAKHREVVGQIKMQVDAGTATQADLDQAQARQGLTDSVRTQFTGRLRDSEARYIEAVGDMPDNLTSSTVRPEYIPADSNATAQQAVASHPALKAARENIAASQSDQAAPEAPFVPKVTFEVRGSRNENVGGSAGPNSDVTTGLFFTYNLYRGGADTARLFQAKSKRAEALLRYDETQRQIEQSARIAHNAFATTRDRISSLEEHAKNAETALESYYQQFQLGKRTLLDVLNVETEPFQARSALVEGQVAQLEAQYQVLASMGRLLPTLGITPPKPDNVFGGAR